ncbi:MAG: RNA polymerase sigma-70 factor [Mucilaginibacter sp.]|uniref:RNA polymerase sigma factor n=1 Tax=Mucilaginibacter sp. TaxID=1882438 RepID=UPI003263CD38
MTITPLYNEQDLLFKIAEGDPNAFRIIFNKYHNKIYTFSLRILQSDIVAEEVVQETMLKLWKMGPTLTTINNLDSYLKTLARNLSIDMLRHRELAYKVEKDLGADWIEGHNETEEQVLLNDTRKVLQAGIELLPDQQKLVYKFCHQDGLKYDEVAEKLKLSPHTVRSYMKLALRFLRNYVSSHTDVAAILIIFKLF